MAKLSYTTPETETHNEARLAYYQIERFLDADGNDILDGEGAPQLVVQAMALVGDFDGSTWTVHERVHLNSGPRKASQVASFFGTSSLEQTEQKILQFMQNEGLLPAGTVS